MLGTLLSSSTTRARVDFVETFAAIDALFYEHGLKATALPPELAVARGHLGVTMATKTFEGERVLRAVVTHVRAAPLFGALSVVAHPKPEVDAPLLLAHLRVLPSGVTHGFFDACGATSGEFDALFRKPLSQTLDAAVASAVRRRRVPSWLESVSSGAGAELAATAGRGHVLSYALLRYVERWLEALARAPVATDAAANAVATRAACDTLHAHGMAGAFRVGKMMGRTFGQDLAARYAAIVWNG